MPALSPTIGLEVHAELNTRSKLFCSCPNNPDEKEPNLNICPVCLGHPGTLPVLNKAAVRAVLLVGTAVGGRLADFSEFDRKNYFYPDIPKGYQISQYKYPLVSGGELQGVALTRIHLEEDTARSQHDTHATHSLVDFNRAGVPLMELVTEPVITSAKQAADFARELQLLLRYLEVSEANLEKGEMRIEANISIAPAGSRGTKVEVKNLNSFRAVEKAIEYELKRQQELLEAGEKIVQETRGWDEVKGVTFSQRQKESSHDYRYFPEPDLPKLKLSEVPEFQNLEATLPELPWQKRERLQKLGLQVQDIEQLLGDFELSALFAEAEAELGEAELIRTAANFILNDIAGQRKKDPAWPLPAAAYLAEVVHKYHEGVIGSPQAKQAILSGKIVAAVDNATLPALVEKILNNNPASVADYKAGKQTALQFLVGQGMRESKGTANPEVLKKLFLEQLTK